MYRESGSEGPGKRNMEKNGAQDRIRFEIPSVSNLSREGFSCVDMHCHTNHSDAPVKVRDALRYAEGKNIGIAVTDHNQVSGSLEAISTASTTLVIPGIEVSALDGPHILVYFYSAGDLLDFYKTFIEKRKQDSPYLAIRASTSDILDWVSGYACICSAAHPYGYLLFNKGIGRCVERNYLEEDLIPRFDAIEVISGGMPRSENIRAVQMAEKYDRGYTGGTDAHLLHDYGRVLTCALSGTVDEFLDGVIRKKNIVVGREKSLVGKGLMGALITPRYVPYLFPSLAIHYEQNIPRIRRFFRRMGGQQK
jgi:predicted metal-dependent phosphoesterase TrpH